MLMMCAAVGLQEARCIHCDPNSTRRHHNWLLDHDPWPFV